MGNVNKTMHDMKVFKVDQELNLLCLEGQIPGKRGSMVRVKDSIKKLFNYNIEALPAESQKEFSEKYPYEYHLRHIENYLKPIRESLQIKLPFPTDYTASEELAISEPLVRDPPDINPMKLLT